MPFTEIVANLTNGINVMFAQGWRAFVTGCTKRGAAVGGGRFMYMKNFGELLQEKGLSVDKSYDGLMHRQRRQMLRGWGFSMRHRTSTIVRVLLLVFVLAMMCGCGAKSSISGKYTDQSGGETLEFKSKNAVLLHSGDRTLSGDYIMQDNVLLITFNMGGYSSDALFYISDKRDTIYAQGSVFTKQKSMPWWGWFLIASAIFGIISWIYETLLKRDIDDDLEKIGEKIEDKIDKLKE